MTILNQYEIFDYDLPTWSYIVLLILGGVAIISAFFTSEKGVLLSRVMIFVVITWGVFSILCFKKEIPTGRYRYECTVDENTSFVEICEKYDVVEQKGDLWVLEDKVDG